MLSIGNYSQLCRIRNFCILFSLYSVYTIPGADTLAVPALHIFSWTLQLTIFVRYLFIADPLMARYATVANVGQSSVVRPSDVRPIMATFRKRSKIDHSYKEVGIADSFAAFRSSSRRPPTLGRYSGCKYTIYANINIDSCLTLASDHSCCQPSRSSSHRRCCQLL